jgi:hypothetical protein
LQVIDNPHKTEVESDAFFDCPLLSTILEEHGTVASDRMRGRFDELPIHQTCYNLNNNTSQADNDSIINYFQSLQDNDPALLQVDIMGMTPLHILCANPAVTKDMIKQLYSKNTEAAAVRNVNDMLPWHMYVINKDKQFRMFNEHETEYDDDGFPTFRMTDTAGMILGNDFDADRLTAANLDIDMIEMYLILTGLSLTEWFETANAVTGLYPFMSMATKSKNYKLEEVYDVAMMNLNSCVQ